MNDHTWHKFFIWSGCFHNAWNVLLFFCYVSGIGCIAWDDRYRLSAISLPMLWETVAFICSRFPLIDTVCWHYNRSRLYCVTVFSGIAVSDNFRFFLTHKYFRKNIPSPETLRLTVLHLQAVHFFDIIFCWQNHPKNFFPSKVLPRHFCVIY
jgi:hypothetical protein